jgi:arylsulfatase A-like enzyme
MSPSPLDSLFFGALTQGSSMALLVAAVVSVALMVKSLLDFTRTGPEMAEEVLAHYRLYLAASLGRLLLAAFAITAFLALPGVVLYAASLVLLAASYQPIVAFGASLLSVALLTGLRFVHTLHRSPGVIAASSLYSMTHFHPLWRLLSAGRLRALDLALLALAATLVLAALAALTRQGAWPGAALLIGVCCFYAVVGWLAARDQEAAPSAAPRHPDSRPNILLIGSDTLRFDRLSGAGYPRELTPNLARLAKRATLFTDCYVPCARTAPSLVSLLSGTWPHTHGVRDTFVTPEQTQLEVPALPQLLKAAGYQSAIVGDWAASDADKFNFGFDYRDLPQDQWNIKFLLRQGPKDLRLFLSLFTQNPLGKALLPEIYYLGGIPLTEEVGRDTRRMIGKLAQDGRPFFLMSFMATTHPPFTSKYPYYSLFSDPDYQGESKFIMAKLRDPWEIIRAQAEPRSKFDLDQVIDLYDGCVRNFDDEVARILAYLKASNLADNTIVVIFSDHGFEFFEHETWGQGNSAIGDFSARVPIIIADPRIDQPERVGDVIRTVDIAPTLLDLAGVPIPDSMEGVSLARPIRGERLGAELPAFYETGVWLTDLPGTPDGHLRYPHLPELLEVPDKDIGMISLKPKYFDIVIAAKDRMVRKGKWKLTYQPLSDGAIYRLFDIENDPGCKDNLVARYPAVAAELRSLLDRWMADDPQLARPARPSVRAADADSLVSAPDNIAVATNRTSLDER